MDSFTSPNWNSSSWLLGRFPCVVSGQFQSAFSHSSCMIVISLLTSSPLWTLSSGCCASRELIASKYFCTCGPCSEMILLPIIRARSLRICASFSFRLVSFKIVMIWSVVSSRSSASARILRTLSNNDAWRCVRLVVVIPIGDPSYSFHCTIWESHKKVLYSIRQHPLFLVDYPKQLRATLASWNTRFEVP